jgi:hypothetical protein
MFYYAEGDSTSVVSPDIFVVKGVSKELRRVYKLWLEGAAPCFVLEITSCSSRGEDMGRKRDLYAMLGVQEYFLFDPTEDYLRPPFQGYTLVDREYHRIQPNHDGSLTSRELGLRWTVENHRLCLRDAATGERLLRPSELFEARRAEAEARRAAEQQARQEAEARRAETRARRAAEQHAKSVEMELERLKAELARLRLP